MRDVKDALMQVVKGTPKPSTEEKPKVTPARPK